MLVFKQTPEFTATQALEASVLARTHVSDTEFVVESVSITRPQALNQNH